MRIVVLKLEVFVFETEDVLYIGIDTHGGQRTWVAGELQFHLFEVVHVDVCVAQCVDEVSGLQPCHLCHHLQQQCIGGDIEGHT